MANLYPTKKDRDGFFDFLPSWFDEWGHNFFHNGGLQTFAADVQERDDAYSVKLDLPGFSKENIHLDFDRGVLTVEATRDQQTTEKAKDGSFIRKERASGSYTRHFMFDGVKEDEIKAAFKDGVLEITLPKKENSKHDHKEITIN
ncbi:Hsp20/alpha crystallin family protein [Sporolactobacillus shoreicorticis]|uniref:Hsp20/alpha crystallin family protein n=1 Tax=Sporolactobacillus shoreicorticis TaxID=1923877 RepID=A0ABW5RZA9_9BACL|nr:Hsp20/alpha crystallin family protein [Sporolactobacillus shoreicorticis]MCO7126808.1 Hsp20/alpha crystallin family protein [Sporolactobacillus shoreicorticis]